MDPTTEALRHSRQERKDQRVERAVTDLASVFSILDQLGGSSQLGELHTAHVEDVRAGLRERPALCTLVSRFVLDAASAATKVQDILDPVFQQNLCALLGHLAAEYPECFAGTEREIARHCLRRALRQTAEAFVVAVGEQAIKLAEGVVEIVRLLGKVRQLGSRIVLLELPVGNSIPVRLLERQLAAAGYSVSVVRTSLSHNDKASQGVKRADLLATVLGGFAFREGDLLLYVDEWCTGSNFKSLCKYIAKALGKSSANVTFLPIGLLSPAAHADRRFPDFIKAHEVYLREAGVTDHPGLVTFPPVDTAFSKRDRFFWAESDRMAGYRKMQFLGSIYSSLDGAVERLRHDPTTLMLAHQLFLEEAASKGKIPDEFKDDARGFTITFAASYRAYQNCKPDIGRIVHESNLGLVEDNDESLAEVSAAIEKIVRDGRATFCVGIASLWLRESGRIDPDDRYFLEAHVPVLGELRGEHRLFHDAVTDALHRLVEQAGPSSRM
jgi:hypothetical protein